MILPNNLCLNQHSSFCSYQSCTSLHTPWPLYSVRASISSVTSSRGLTTSPSSTFSTRDSMACTRTRVSSLPRLWLLMTKSPHLRLVKMLTRSQPLTFLIWRWQVTHGHNKSTTSKPELRGGFSNRRIDSGCEALRSQRVSRWWPVTSDDGEWPLGTRGLLSLVTGWAQGSKSKNEEALLASKRFETKRIHFTSGDVSSWDWPFTLPRAWHLLM